MKFPAIKPCWLVWTLNRNGATMLRAVDTTEDMADAHEAAVMNEPMVERSFIEKSRLNHLYFGMFEKGAPDAKTIKAALRSVRLRRPSKGTRAGRK